jgi:DNA-binding HxlR family transcriptional regulator
MEGGSLVRPSAGLGLETAVKVIGAKWAPSIVHALSSGDRRFGELQRELTGISHKVLIQRLRELERDGVVRRQVIAGGPRHVRYTLTPLGLQLLPILELLDAWGAQLRAALTPQGRRSADSA